MCIVSGLKFSVLSKPIKCCASLEVLIALWMKIEDFWDMLGCECCMVIENFGGACCLFYHSSWTAFYPEDRRNKPFRNVSSCSPLDAAPYPGKLESSIKCHLHSFQNIFRFIEAKPCKRQVNLTFLPSFKWRVLCLCRQVVIPFVHVSRIRSCRQFPSE
jgi:hypothetical protein